MISTEIGCIISIKKNKLYMKVRFSSISDRELTKDLDLDSLDEAFKYASDYDFIKDLISGCSFIEEGEKPNEFIVTIPTDERKRAFKNCPDVEIYVYDYYNE